MAMARFCEKRLDLQGFTSVLPIVLRLLMLAQFAALILMTERPAKAYVDPGSGLLVFQMLGASVAGVLFFIRRKLQTLFNSKARKGPARPPRRVTTLAVGYIEETVAE